MACNLTVLSHCPACKANGLDVLAANHPSLPVAAASIPTPSSDCTSSSSSIQQEQLLRDINIRLDKHEARMEQLLELVEGNANNIRNETNSVISSSSSPRDADVQGGSNGVPSSSSSRPPAALSRVLSGLSAHERLTGHFTEVSHEPMTISDSEISESTVYCHSVWLRNGPKGRLKSNV